ncbi:MAG: hypothetical protein LBB38_03100 [Puniceicoccales bacterium]|jgi:hypothetical protein|nr:hypothetical protein [Puniceicoccales bacterium]
MHLRWVILLLLANGVLVAALAGNRGCSGSAPAAVTGESCTAEVKKVLFADGVEAVLRNGSWHFVGPISWPADSIAMENAYAGLEVENGTVQLLERQWKDFLNRSLLPSDLMEPRRLRIEFGGRTILLKKKESAWISLPSGAVDEIRLEEFLRCLSLATFRDVVGDGFAVNLGEPQLLVVARGDFKDQCRRFEFFLCESAVAVVRIDSGQLFALSPEDVKSMMVAAVELRSKKIFSGLCGEKILWRDENALTVLRRGDVNRSIAATSACGAVAAVGSENLVVYGKILELSLAEVVVEDATATEIVLYGLDHPRLEIDVDGHTLLIGQTFGDRIYGFDRKRNAIVSLMADDIAAICDAIANLRR